MRFFFPFLVFFWSRVVLRRLGETQAPPFCQASTFFFSTTSPPPFFFFFFPFSALVSRTKPIFFSLVSRGRLSFLVCSRPFPLHRAFPPLLPFLSLRKARNFFFFFFRSKIPLIRRGRALPSSSHFLVDSCFLWSFHPGNSIAQDGPYPFRFLRTFSSCPPSLNFLL